MKKIYDEISVNVEKAVVEKENISNLTTNQKKIFKMHERLKKIGVKYYITIKCIVDVQNIEKIEKSEKLGKEENIFHRLMKKSVESLIFWEKPENMYDFCGLTYRNGVILLLDEKE